MTTTTSTSTVAAAPPIWAPEPELPSSAPVWSPEPEPTTSRPTVWEPTPVPAPSISAPVIGVPEPSPVSSSTETSSALPSADVSQPSVPVWSAPSAVPSESVSSTEPTSWAPTPTTLITLISSITEAPVPMSTTHTPDDGLWYSAKYPPHHNGTEGRFWNFRDKLPVNMAHDENSDTPAFLSNANATAIAIAAPIATLFGLVFTAGLIWFILRRRSRRRALAKAKEEQAKGLELRDVAQVRVRAGGKGREVWDEEEAVGKARGNAV
ncbi:hypothetical protein HYQ44_005064 [Verticillium longisporum]|nr:hypothetical protein HYQ44_005064 [Verticillium longisporum]